MVPYMKVMWTYDFLSLDGLFACAFHLSPALVVFLGWQLCEAGIAERETQIIAGPWRRKVFGW